MIWRSMFKIIAVDNVVKSNSSMGNWAIPFDIKYKDSITANSFFYFFRKDEAIAKYTELRNKIGIYYHSITEL